jgi:ribosomal protein S21
MAVVTVDALELLNRALLKLRKGLSVTGVARAMRRHEAAMRPSERKRRKRELARKRRMKREK